MNILAFLLVGLVAGWLATVLVEGHGLGVVGDIVVGIVGAFVGGFIFNVLAIDSYGLWGAIGTSAVGAVVFLFIVGLFSGSHRLGRRIH